jgi:hypothetical protein
LLAKDCTLLAAMTCCKGQLLHLIHQAFYKPFLMSPKHHRSGFFNFTVEKAALHVQNVAHPSIKIHILMVEDLLSSHSSSMAVVFSLMKGKEHLEIF